MDEFEKQVDELLSDWEGKCGSSESYYALADELKQSIDKMQQEIHDINAIRRRNRHDLKLREKTGKTIKGLVEEEKEIKCEIRRLQNIGKKLRTSSNAE